MSENNNLEDIVLDDKKSKKNKTLLVVLIFSVMLLLISVILAISVIFYNENDEQTVVDDGDGIVLSIIDDTNLSQKEVTQTNSSVNPDRVDTLISKLKEEEKNISKPLVENDIKKPVVEEVVTKFKKDVKKTTKIIKNINKNYFVQVGATFSKPSKKFLSDLQSKGYKYTLHDVDINGKRATKILLGGYTKENAQKALIDAKANIAKGAYIYKMK